MKETGFTVIELLLTVTIVVIIGAISGPFYSRFLLQNAVSTTGDQFIGQFRKAQLYAMMGRQNGSWGVRFGSNILTLFQGTTYASRNSAFDETFSMSSTVTISGFSEVAFARMTGLPNTTPTVSISGGSTTQSMSINAQGVASR